MSSNSYFLFSGTVFCFVAIAHLMRIVMALPVTVGGWAVPMLPSWLFLIMTGILSYAALRLAGAG